MDNYTEIDLIKFSEYVFNNNCKDPQTIQLTVQEDQDLLDIFEMLLIIFTEGMKNKFGVYNTETNKVSVNLEDLSKSDFNKINQYFNSFGFNCFYEIINYYDYNSYRHHIDDIIINTTNLSEKKNVLTQNTKLLNIKYTIKCKELVYIIYFDFYKIL